MLFTCSYHPRLTGFFCIVLAVAIGIAYLLFGAAPIRYAGINAAALLLGSALLFLIQPSRWSTHISGVFSIAIGMLLNVTAIWGESTHGAHRWLSVGGFSFEPSLIFVAFIAVLFAQTQNVYSAAGLILIALSTAIQPDRSVAGALWLGLLALLIVERNRWTIGACAVAAIAFAATLLRADTVPPEPFVEKIFSSAFLLSRLLGVAVVTGAILILLPACVGLVREQDSKGTYSAFAGVWMGLLAAAVLGNYPTPILGYGSSAILGYLLSLSCLPDGNETKRTHSKRS